MYKLIFVFFLSFNCFLHAQTGTLKGFVKDSLTNEPLAGANIIIKDTPKGTTTDQNGFYSVELPVGSYTVKCTFIGYNAKEVQIQIEGKKTVELSFNLIPGAIQSESIQVTAGRVNSQEMKSTVVSNLTSYAAVPKAEFNTEEYAYIEEGGFRDVAKSPLSTFSIDVDAASYSNSRRFLMDGQMPPKDAVRIEEFINYFDYDYSTPKNSEPFEINLEYSDCPWNKDHGLVHIGLKGIEPEKKERTASNLTFLIDVSGSMNQPDKLPLLKRALKMLVENLNPDDRVSIVVYAGAAGLILNPTSGEDKTKILDAIENLEAGGSTAGGAGIQLAYKTASENFIKGGNNRVILATDGDFNVEISNTSELVRFITEQKSKGIFLTVLGFGGGNLKDSRLEDLADKGDGNYAYIDNILEAKKVLVDEIGSTLFTIAKDVKIQVEFNPLKVKSYRLVGYENRMLNAEDFENDKKDAGEIGAGHTVTALYEIEYGKADNNDSSGSGLKYQVISASDKASQSNEILTVNIRYKKPDEDKSNLIIKALKDKKVAVEKTSDNFKFSAAVAEFGMLLRDSQFKGNSDYDSVKRLAESSKGEDKNGYRAEFLRLVDLAEEID